MRQYKDTHFYATPFGEVYKLTKNGYEKRGWSNSRNYIHVSTSDRKSIKVHRIIAELFIPNPNNLPHVNHINGITTDNRVENLEWVTPGDNQRHAYRSKLRVPKLSLSDIEEIKFKLSKGIKQKEIAEEYSICRSMVSAIKTNKRYGS